MIIAFTGQKSSGKDTAAGFVDGEVVKFAGGLKHMLRVALKGAGVPEEIVEEMIEGGLKEVETNYLDPDKMDRVKFCADLTYGLMQYQGACYGDYMNSLRRSRYLDGKTPFAVNYSLLSTWWNELRKGPFTPRHAMITLGTEWGRCIMGENFWVNITARKIKTIPGNVKITDVRFPNEAAKVKELGGMLLRVERPGTEASSGSHESEALIASLDVDGVITNDGTLEDLSEKVRQMITETTGQ